MPWTPCSQQLPDSETTVMTYSPESQEPVWPAYHDGEQWVDLMGAPIIDAPITHWMNFPEPPVEGDLLSQFFEEKCLGGQDLSISFASFYGCFYDWCAGRPEGTREVPSRRMIGRQMSKMGFVLKLRRGGVIISGLIIRAAA